VCVCVCVCDGEREDRRRVNVRPDLNFRVLGEEHLD